MPLRPGSAATWFSPSRRPVSGAEGDGDPPLGPRLHLQHARVDGGGDERLDATRTVLGHPDLRVTVDEKLLLLYE
jgi:hypothetical protein